jgi:uncharacterized protein (TIGR02145 family)
MWNTTVTATIRIPRRQSVSADPVSDIDGNEYQTVKIGNQVWTVENLRTTKYNDGTAIPLVADSAAWVGLTTPGYSYCNNTTNADSIRKYGALYNWYVVSPANPKKIAPAGWHVPTEAEWDTLKNYLIANGYNWDGSTTGNKIAKAMAASTDWMPTTSAGAMGNDLTINNESGFSALPGGYRWEDGRFFRDGSFGYWWSATESRATSSRNYYLNKIFESLVRSDFDKSCGHSLRLVRD